MFPKSLLFKMLLQNPRVWEVGFSVVLPFCQEESKGKAVALFLRLLSESWPSWWLFLHRAVAWKVTEKTLLSGQGKLAIQLLAMRKVTGILQRACLCNMNSKVVMSKQREPHMQAGHSHGLNSRAVQCAGMQMFPLPAAMPTAQPQHFFLWIRPCPLQFPVVVFFFSF